MMEWRPEDHRGARLASSGEHRLLDCLGQGSHEARDPPIPSPGMVLVAVITAVAIAVARYGETRSTRLLLSIVGDADDGLAGVATSGCERSRGFGK
jgi:hypothetical protein